MKIAIIELHYHEEFLHTLIQLFQHQSVDVFTTKSIYNNLPEKSKYKPKFIFQLSTQKTKHFLSTIPTNEYDFLFLNTVQPSMIDIPKYLNFKPKCKSCITLHNLNAWRNKKLVPRKNFILSGDSFIASFYTNKILHNFDCINVVNSTMIPYAQLYFPTHRIINIPFSLAKPKNELKMDKESEETWFVVPGTVDDRRRDYRPVLKAYSKLNDAKLILLGKLTYKVNTHSADVKTFNDFVPQEKYDFYLRNADFIICPSVQSTHTVNVNTEYYGKTKSPNLFEAIKWRKPLLLPCYIPVPSQIESSTLSYAGAESLEQLMLYATKHKHRISEDAFKNSNYYTLKKTYKRLNDMVFGEVEK